MKASFLHLGDVHLGNEQYGRKERAADFAEAFHYALDYAIDKQVDFVIVAGDLFERATLDPVTFDQALSGLKKLAYASIPIIAIAGNHDRARYGQEISWLESLGRQGFLQYLDAVADGSVRLSPWSFEAGVGGYVDFQGLRLVGFRYIGAATARVVEELGRQMAEADPNPRPYTIAMIHAGLDGEVPNFRAELTYDQLAPLRGLADYVALGHLHKHYQREGWVYNPGSLETWNASEVSWERGFLHVEVDTSAEPRHTARLIIPPRRPFLRYRLDVQPCTSPESLLELLRRSMGEWKRQFHAEKPVVHLSLSGRLRFDRRDLDLGRLQAEITETLDPLVVQVRDQTDETAFEVHAAEEGMLDRAALEADVLRQLFANDERRVHQAAAWAKLAQSLKTGAISKESPDILVDLVRREAAPLLDETRESQLAHKEEADS
ncbi:MAG TPA: exonuclease SbcCD subunit D [Chloroflexota bacterium]